MPGPHPKLTFSSANWAEKHHLKFDQVISVRSPDSPPRLRRRHGKILRLCLEDEDYLFDNDTHAKAVETVEKTLAFCRDRQPRNLLIHCQAGFARSSALTALLALSLNPDTAPASLFSNLWKLRQAGESPSPDIYPTRTLLLAGEQVLARNDLLDTAFASFSTERHDARLRLHARNRGRDPQTDLLRARQHGHHPACLLQAGE